MKTIKVKGSKYFKKGKNYSCRLVTAGKGAKVLYCSQQKGRLSNFGAFLEKEIAKVDIGGKSYVCDLHSMEKLHGGKRLYCHRVLPRAKPKHIKEGELLRAEIEQAKKRNMTFDQWRQIRTGDWIRPKGHKLPYGQVTKGATMKGRVDVYIVKLNGKETTILKKNAELVNRRGFPSDDLEDIWKSVDVTKPTKVVAGGKMKAVMELNKRLPLHKKKKIDLLLRNEESIDEAHGPNREGYQTDIYQYSKMESKGYASSYKPVRTDYIVVKWEDMPVQLLTYSGKNIKKADRLMRQVKEELAKLSGKKPSKVETAGFEPVNFYGNLGLIRGVDIPAWRMTFSEYIRQSSLPSIERVPSRGQYAAVRTDDGSIYFDPDWQKSTHVLFIKNAGIPPERVIGGGWIVDGVYDETTRSDTERFGKRARAIKRLEYRNLVWNALDQGKPVPSKVKEAVLKSH